MAINKRKIPEVNAGSMADIAFLLLIFFLVATTMNTDTGINRVLPPWVEKQKVEDAPPIKERNLLSVKVNQYDQIQMQGQRVDLSQVKDVAKNFILNPANDTNLPEKEIVNIEFIGDYPVSSGVISLQNDRGTSYETYVKVQNELTRAFNEVRNEVAMQSFGVVSINELDEAKRKAIQEAVPNKISEAEPKNIGGR